jgi:hypothetical protein
MKLSRKAYLFALIVIVTFITSCKTGYIITTQNELNGRYPCLISDTGVNVRVRNAGKITFSKIAIKYGKEVMFFEGLKPGGITCYKNVPAIWTANNVDVFFSKQHGYDLKLENLMTDQIGEKELTFGNVTIEIKIIESHNRLGYYSNVVIEKE